MRQIISFTLAFLFLFISAQAQDESSTPQKIGGLTSFYAELGGPGILFSANLDRRFKQSHLGWGGRVGLGFVTFYDENFVSTPTGGYYTDGNQASVVTFPVQINYIFGKGSSPHTFEVGGGITVAGKKIDVFNFRDEEESALFGTASFMYRRQPINGGFMWKAGFTPIIAKGYIQPSGGVSVGYNF